MELKRLEKEQENLKNRLKLIPFKKNVNLAGGCDVSYYKDRGTGVFVIIDRNFKIVEEKYFNAKIDFPYIPGFLLYREIKFLIGAYNKLKLKPDIIFVDGNGILHPRKMGIASYLGVLLKRATIGCAKNLLLGKYRKIKFKRGNKSAIKVNSEILGYALVTRENVKPLFVSPGNLIDFKSAIKYTLLFSKFRIPEPIRIAHIKGKSLSKKIDFL